MCVPVGRAHLLRRAPGRGARQDMRPRGHRHRATPKGPKCGIGPAHAISPSLSALGEGGGCHIWRDRGQCSGPGRGGAARQGRQQGQRGKQEARKRRRGERARGRQRQHTGGPGQPAPSLPGARATPCSPGVRWGGVSCSPDGLSCTTRDGGHQGQTSRDGGRGRQGCLTPASAAPQGRACPPPPPPSVPLLRLFTRQGTTPPSTSRVGPTQVSGQGTRP